METLLAPEALTNVGAAPLDASAPPHTMEPAPPEGLLAAVPNTLQITAAKPESALLDLPWRLPLEEWPDEVLAALPRGISRHVVRFVRSGKRILAVKETRDHFAYREYDLLRRLGKLEVPCVTPVAVVTGRIDADGEPLETAIVTEHLPFSLPYRVVFSQALQPETATRLIDALAVLIVRLHLIGFYWGDVSLSNTLFRRDADQFAAYLVDAETGELHRTLTEGQRAYDIDLARTNIIGELFDLEAGELLSTEIDPIAIGDRFVERYWELWCALNDVESFAANERWRVDERIRRLNDLGFDVGELNIVTDFDGTTVRIEPKVVDAGYHSRRMLRLTGLDVQENQARRMLNEIDTWRAEHDQWNESEQLVAHDWLLKAYEPTINAVPKEMKAKLEPAQLFHEILDHRWYLAEDEKRDVSLAEAAKSYIDKELKHKPDEEALLTAVPGETALLEFNQLRNLDDTMDLADIEAVAAEDAAKLASLRQGAPRILREGAPITLREGAPTIPREGAEEVSDDPPKRVSVLPKKG